MSFNLSCCSLFNTRWQQIQPAVVTQTEMEPTAQNKHTELNNDPWTYLYLHSKLFILFVESWNYNIWLLYTQELSRVFIPCCKVLAHRGKVGSLYVWEYSPSYCSTCKVLFFTVLIEGYIVTLILQTQAEWHADNWVIWAFYDFLLFIMTNRTNPDDTESQVKVWVTIRICAFWGQCTLRTWNSVSNCGQNLLRSLGGCWGLPRQERPFYQKVHIIT